MGRAAMKKRIPRIRPKTVNARKFFMQAWKLALRAGTGAMWLK